MSDSRRSEPLGIAISIKESLHTGTGYYFIIDRYEIRTGYLAQKVAKQKASHYQEVTSIIIFNQQTKQYFEVSDIYGAEVRQGRYDKPPGFCFDEIEQQLGIPDVYVDDETGIRHFKGKLSDATTNGKTGVFQLQFAKVPRQDSFYTLKNMELLHDMRLKAIRLEVNEEQTVFDLKLHYFPLRAETVQMFTKLISKIESIESNINLN